MNVANILVENPECAIIVVGGRLRRSDGGWWAPSSTQTIAQFSSTPGGQFCSALDADGDMARLRTSRRSAVSQAT